MVDQLGLGVACSPSSTSRRMASGRERLGPRSAIQRSSAATQSSEALTPIIVSFLPVGSFISSSFAAAHELIWRIFTKSGAPCAHEDKREVATCLEILSYRRCLGKEAPVYFFECTKSLLATLLIYLANMPHCSISVRPN